MHESLCVCAHLCVCINVYACVCVSACACMCECVCVCTGVYGVEEGIWILGARITVFAGHLDCYMCVCGS